MFALDLAVCFADDAGLKLSHRDVVDQAQRVLDEYQMPKVDRQILRNALAAWAPKRKQWPPIFALAKALRCVDPNTTAESLRQTLAREGSGFTKTDGA